MEEAIDSSLDFSETETVHLLIRVNNAVSSLQKVFLKMESY
jgi:hypothetical protein